MSAVPSHADATRAAHLRAALRSRTYAYAVVLGATVAGVAGAALWGPMGALAGGLGVPAAVTLWAFAHADRRAEEDFWRGLARALGFVVHADPPELPAFTPLLAAGDARRLVRWLEGPLDGERRAGLGHLVVEERDRARDGRDVRVRGTEHTVVVVDVEGGAAPWCSGVHVHPRRLLDPLRPDGWLPRDAERLATESTAFEERYVLRAEPDADPVKVRRLLSPSFVDWLARHPLAPGFEYRAGVLVVFRAGHAADAGSLTFLLDAAREITARIAAQATQDRDAAAADPARA